MTIVEFLRARYDEREAGVRDALRIEDYGTTERDLIEVQALSRIVDLHEGSHECSVYERRVDHAGRASVEIDSFTFCLNSEDCSTLQLLALPYADHPDYDPAWRLPG